MNKFWVLLLLPLSSMAQDRIDGIAAVVGDQIILDSDIAQMKQYMKAQGGDTDNSCQFIDQMLFEKTITYQAKQDTILQQNITNDKIQQSVDQRISFFLDQVGGSEERLLQEFNLQTMAELQEEMMDLVRDQAFTEQKRESIVSDIDVSPEELKSFYNKHKYDLPDVNEEVELSHIVLFPELTPEHQQELIDKLNTIREKVLDGKSTFDEEARLYSQDPGSAKDGGLYERVPRGKMVKEFDAVAFNLEEGEISEPFETEFGYHIIQLIKRRGQLLDLRHILLQSEPNSEEIKTAEKKLDSIKTLIIGSEMTFKQAAYQFSDDKYSRYNAGIMSNPQTGDTKLEKFKLSTNEFYAIAGLKSGDYTDVFEDEFQTKKAVRLIYLRELIPAHKLSLEQDYNRIKKYAKEEKKQSVLDEYVKSKIPDTNIVISKEYSDCTYTYDWLQEDKL